MSVVSVENEINRNYAQTSATIVHKHRLLTDTDIDPSTRPDIMSGLAQDSVPPNIGGAPFLEAISKPHGISDCPPEMSGQSGQGGFWISDWPSQIICNSQSEIRNS